MNNPNDNEPSTPSTPPSPSTPPPPSNPPTPDPDKQSDDDRDRDRDADVAPDPIPAEQGYAGYRPPQPDNEEYSLESGPDSPPLHTDDRTRTEQPVMPRPDTDV